MKCSIDKVYEPKLIENDIYRYWQENNFFNVNTDSDKSKYSIVMPPPNITGSLHMGHALDCTLQDILIRYKRMCNFESLWVPGTDHAAIATEVKIVEELKKEGLDKKSLGREKFVKRALSWKEKYREKIVKQIQKIGSSCDWSRERFTLDEGCSKAVKKFFIDLYRKRMIYRGEKIINWCTTCLTSISDTEVEFENSKSELIYLKYFFCDSDEFLVVATTRPETIFGDVALAVSPSDERYKKIIGKSVLVPISEKKIYIISDDCVDKSFGTGVLKVTPAHDFIDFEIGMRHGLEQITVIDKNGLLNNRCEKYEGIDRFKARMMIVNDLNSQGFIFKKEKIENNLGKCYRCGCIVEPIISTQWFVKMDKLAKPAIEIVKKKQISFIPERFSKIYMHWMNKIKDWCISRQLWWGHRIPAWYCKNCDYITVEIEPSKCEKCNSKDIKQDEDSLDTWFSSALWPFSSLGWPEKTEIFLKFYPTDVLVTGYDIIFFWVARMIFSALELTGTRPFKKVLIHGLVRDSEGKKMSKSLGNGIDPLEIISKYGADALRLALITGLTPGNDTRFCEKKIEGARNFINKIWNAARFIQINLGEKIKINEIDIKNLPIHHAWMLSRINEVTKHVHKNIENFEFGICLHNIYNMFWDEFCDWYIEFCKIDIKRDTSFNILCYVFFRILKLLHPFIPFVTEKIWSIFNSCPLIISEYPKYDTSFGNHLAEESMNKLISCIRTIRSKRNEMNTPCTKKIKIFIITEDNELFSNNCDKIKSLVCASEVIINTDPDSKKEFLTSFSECAKILISVDDLIDRNELKNRIEKELKILNNSRIKSQNLIKNQNFISNAPKDIVQKIKNRIDDDTRKIEKLKLEILKYSSF